MQVDFRFWVVALKPLSPRQALATLSYVLPFTFFVVVAFRGLGELFGQPVAPVSMVGRPAPWPPGSSC